MRRYFSLLCILALLVGCYNTDEQLINEPIHSEDRIFTASFEQNDTRTYVEEGNLLRWNEGDQITIFDSNTLNQQYQFDGETGDNGGTFSKVNNPFGTGNDLNCHYAVYPYNKDIKITETGVITADLPTEQSYAENSFGLGANTMVAVTKDVDDTFLKFKNVGGYLKLQLYGENLTIKSITLTGNNHEKIAGKATVTPAYEQTPTLAMSDDATTRITLDCGDGVKIGATAETATAFWIVVPPTTFEEGLTITVTEIDGESFTKSTSNAVVVERNIIKPMAVFEVEIEKIANNQIWYTSTDGNIVNPSRSVAFSVNIESNVYINGKGIITFDGDVTTIGYGAFAGCSNLTSVTLPNSVTKIADVAFLDCPALTSISIPSSVINIPGPPCHICPSLANIVVEQDNPIYDSRENCNAIIETKTNKLIQGSNTTIIPNSVTEIERFSFMAKTISEITIPNGVTTIGECAFTGCSQLTKVNVLATTPPTIYSDTFYNCGSDMKVYVPAGSLEAYKAAEYWKDLNIMTDTIPNNQIWYTSSDGNVVTPGKNTFSAITGSANVFATITSNVYSNGRGVITFDSDIDEICHKAFYSFTTLTSVTIPNSVTYIGNNAFGKCTSLISVELPNNITSMGDAFNSCSSLTRVSLPNKLTEIPSQLFYGCTSLSEVTIPEGVTKVGQSAFYGCSSLSTITIPNSVTTIQQFAFAATGIINFTFPNKIKTISAYSVYNCPSLENITIPSTVTTIEYSAFFANDALKTVRIYATQPPTITNGNAIFNGNTHTTCVLEVPKGRSSVYYNSTGWAFSTIREFQ